MASRGQDLAASPSGSSGFQFTTARRGSGASEKAKGHPEFETAYRLVRVLGTGWDGEVWHAVRRSSGASVAVKIVTVPEVARRTTLVRGMVESEIKALIALEHAGVINLQEVYRHGMRFYMVMDFMEGGELLDQILVKTYEEDEARTVMRRLCEAVKYFHGKGYMHRDIKAENILLCSGSRTGVVLADFGLATKFEGCRLTRVCGSILYMSPEVVRCRSENSAGEGYTEKADVWSLGVTMYIMLSGEAPFDHESDEVLLQLIEHGALDFSAPPFAAVSDACREFLTSLLTKDADDRPSMAEALQHPWLQGLGGLGGPADFSEMGWEQHLGTRGGRDVDYDWQGVGSDRADGPNEGNSWGKGCQDFKPSSMDGGADAEPLGISAN